MKAKEYFEKYFSDLNYKSDKEINDNIASFVQDLTNEAVELLEKRHATTDDALIGGLKEQNNKFNSVNNMIAKKYGTPLMKRSGFMEYWRRRYAEGGDLRYDQT